MPGLGDLSYGSLNRAVSISEMLQVKAPSPSARPREPQLTMRKPGSSQKPVQNVR